MSMAMEVLGLVEKRDTISGLIQPMISINTPSSGLLIKSCKISYILIHIFLIWKLKSLENSG